MTNNAVNKNNSDTKKTTLKKIILFSLAAMILVLILWHVLLPLLGITIAITTGIWGVAIITTVLICISTLLFFIFTGVGIFILGAFVFAWAVLAIILFPLLFPIVLPVLLLMFVVGFISKRNRE